MYCAISGASGKAGVFIEGRRTAEGPEPPFPGPGTPAACLAGTRPRSVQWSIGAPVRPGSGFGRPGESPQLAIKWQLRDKQVLGYPGEDSR